VLWVEDLLTEKGTYDIVMFNKVRKLGDIYFYSISKRSPFKAEIQWIEEALATLSVKEL